VRYADPWRNSAAGQWEAVAYIDREEAWKAYSPQAKFRKKTEPFFERRPRPLPLDNHF
jgi:hypothetical protein